MNVTLTAQFHFHSHKVILTSQHPRQVPPDEIYIIPQQKSTEVKSLTQIH